MTPVRRKCCRCGKLTHKWQRINGSPWHCYDNCFSTTGFDSRTYDGSPLWENPEKKVDWSTGKIG